MHICRLCPEFYSKKSLKGGLTTHMYDLTVALKKLEVMQTVIAGKTSGGTFKGIQVHKLNSTRPFSLLRQGIAAFYKIKQLNKKFDAIHFHNPGFALLGLFRNKLPPLIMTIHASPFDLVKNCNYRSLRAIKETYYFLFTTWIGANLVDKIVCVSPGVSHDLVTKLMIPRAKVETITPGIDQKLFFPKKEKKQMDILVVGRFAPVKRHKDIIKAIELVILQHPTLKAVFLGYDKNDPAFNEVSSLIQEKKMQENITLVPFVPQKQLAGYYRRSKILINASVAEGSPKVVMEAMACGLPVISTDIIGVKHLITNEKTGFLVPIKSPHKIAEKINVLLDNQSLCRKIGCFAAKKINKEFSWQAIAKEYKRLYASSIK